MGGSQKELRDEAKKRVASEASEEISDLLFLQKVFHNWSKLTGGKKGRIKYALENGLNSKVLEMVLGTVKQVLPVVQRKPFKKTSLEVFPEVEVVGRCLVSSFKDQIGEMLIPKNPDAGVHLITSNSKGTLSSSSSLAQNSDLTRFFIAMSVTQLPSILIVDQAHPIQLEWLSDDLCSMLETVSLNIVECYTRKNLNIRFCNILRKYFRDIEKEERYARFVICNYDRPSTTVRVFGPFDQKEMIQEICNSIVESQLQSDLNYGCERIIGNGSAIATVIAGFETKEIEQINIARRIHVPNPPC